MIRRTRVGVLAFVGILSVPVMVAAVAWACGPSGYGTPESPAAPPPSTAQPVSPGATVSPPASPQPAAPAVDVQVNSSESASTTASGVLNSSGPAAKTPGNTVGGNTNARRLTGSALINARERGATAGVVQQGKQAVFASSTEPTTAKASKKAAARSAAKSTVAAPSERTVTADLWSGVTGTNPSLASAASSGGDTGGLSGGAVAGLAMLGLALAGITGGALVAAGRRRRAAAGAVKRQ